MNVALRAWINRCRRRIARALLFRIVFGERSQGRLLPNTRVSPSCCIEPNIHCGCSVWNGATRRAMATSACAGSLATVQPARFAAAESMPMR